MPRNEAYDAGRPAKIYVADSESDLVENPGWEMGIPIGDAETGLPCGEDSRMLSWRKLKVAVLTRGHS